MSMIYKRLDPDKPAYTVTGSGGGGTMSIIGTSLEPQLIVSVHGYRRSR